MLVRLMVALVSLALSACGGTATNTGPTTPLPASSAPAAPATSPATSPTTAVPAGAEELVLLTHDSFALSEDVIQRFEQEAGVTLRVLKSGDAAQVVNSAILAHGNPLGDVLFGVDNTLLSRAVAADLFEPYRSGGAAISPAFDTPEAASVTPIDYGDVCVNYDKAAVASGSLSVPHSLADLAQPQYRGKLVVEDPGTSSPGLAFLLATVARFGDTGSYTWRDYWKALRANDVYVSSGWEDAYNAQFSGSSGHGPRPLVVSYASSPPAEVVFADPKPSEAPTAVLTDGCFRQVEYAGILKGTRHERAARAFVDFLLRPEVQADIPLNMFVYPVVEGVQLPDVFVRNAAPVEQPLSLPPAEIEANRERWIQEWTQIVLR